jgi:hypothetical protein
MQVPFKAIPGRTRLWLRVLMGKVYNLAGIPGVVRDCDYSSTTYDARISVRAKELFTIINVNGLDIYFHRLTGSIDGIGFSGTSSCNSERAHESGQIHEPTLLPNHTFQKHTP